MKIRPSAKLAVFLVCLLMTSYLGAEEYRLGEVFAGYSLLHGDLQKSASGWELSAGKNFNQWLSLHADFDGHYQSSTGSQRHENNFLLGPQFSHRTNHFTLFAHALSGACHTRGDLGNETGFALLAGGGIDWDSRSFLSFRLAQVDYLNTRLFGNFQHQARFSLGIVFHLTEFRDPARLPPPEKNHKKPAPDVSPL
jgi:hypothetical protein